MPRTATPSRSGLARWRRGAAPPVLVEMRRDGIVESRHRGHIVQVDPDGRVLRALGDPDALVTLRSTVKPFALVPLIESGAADSFGLTPDELALMAASHSGEDVHVRTLQAVFRRAGISQGLLANGSEGAPLDRITATRLARDGEAAGAIRHNCSGHHAAMILLSKYSDWTLEDYWHPDHPSQQEIRATVARVFGARHDRLRTAVDGCGVQTYAFPLVDVARAYLLLADPHGVARGSRAPLAPTLARIRDAMLGAPEMVGGTRERLDTEVMKAVPGKVVSKGGSEALRAISLLPGASGDGSVATGMAIKIEDGDGHRRAGWAAGVEALRQARVLDAAGLQRLASYHRPGTLDPRGERIGEAVPEFTLAPISELL
jgi:L-asparaginase II